MIAEIDERLRSWVQGVAHGAQISFERPGSAEQPEKGPVVRVHLLKVCQRPIAPSRPRVRAASAFDLHYLIYVDGGPAERAHAILSDLLMEAAESTMFELEPEAIQMSDWLALGIAAQPAFSIRVPMFKEHVQPTAKMVSKISFTSTAVANLSGTVVGPGDIPIPAARVEIPSLRRATQTDHRGRFEFRTVPADPAHMTIVVKAKGRELSISAAELLQKDAAGVIHMTGLEE